MCPESAARLIKEHCGVYSVNFRKAVDKRLPFSFWIKVMVVLTLTVACRHGGGSGRGYLSFRFIGLWIKGSVYWI